MKLIQPEPNVHYYEAYSGDILIGFYPNEDKLIFADWLQDMNDIAIYGCTQLELKARLARLQDLQNGLTPKPLQYYLPIDRRKKYA